MADSTETRPGQAEALTAAGQAVMEVGECLSWSEADDYADAAVRAAYPIIAAAVGEQIARDIEHQALRFYEEGAGRTAFKLAARLARDVR